MNPVTTGTPSAFAAWAVLIIRCVPKAIFSSFVPLQMASVSLPYGPRTIWPSGWLASAEMTSPLSEIIFRSVFALEPFTISSMSSCGLPANAGSSTAW